MEQNYESQHKCSLPNSDSWLHQGLCHLTNLYFIDQKLSFEDFSYKKSEVSFASKNHIFPATSEIKMNRNKSITPSQHGVSSDTLSKWLVFTRTETNILGHFDNEMSKRKFDSHVEFC